MPDRTAAQCRAQVWSGEGMDAEHELGLAIGALPLPWGSAELDAPLARVNRAISALVDSRNPTPPSPAQAGEWEGTTLPDLTHHQAHDCGCLLCPEHHLAARRAGDGNAQPETKE